MLFNFRDYSKMYVFACGIFKSFLFSTDFILCSLIRGSFRDIELFIVKTSVDKIQVFFFFPPFPALEIFVSSQYPTVGF